MNEIPNKYKGKTCRNCGTELRGVENYCPNCGQKNDKRRANIKIFWQSFLDSILSFDNKVLSTLKDLMFYPAKVSLAYIHGQKIRYVNPFKLLLNLGIIFFLLATLTENKSSKEELNSNKFGFQKSTYTSNTKPEKYYQKLSDFATKHQVDSLFKARDIPSEKKEIAYRNLLQINYLKIPDSFSFKAFQHMDTGKKTTRKINTSLYNSIHLNRYFKEHNVPFQTDKILDGIRQKFEDFNWFVKTPFFSEVIKIPKYREMEAKEILENLHLEKSISNLFSLKMKLFLNGDKKTQKSMQQKFFSYLPFTLYFFLPFFTLIMLAIYSDRQYNYTEQLIFVFNLQSAFFVMAIITTIMGVIIESKWDERLLLLGFGIYLFFSLKKFYEENSIKSLLKMLFLVIPVYFALASISFVLAFFGILLFV